MNWKREAIDKLKNYEAHKQALECLTKEIKPKSQMSGVLKGCAVLIRQEQFLTYDIWNWRSKFLEDFQHGFKGTVTIVSTQPGN